MSAAAKKRAARRRVDRSRSLKLSTARPPADMTVNREAFLRSEQPVDPSAPSTETAIGKVPDANSLRVQLQYLTGDYATKCRDAVEAHISRVLQSNGTA